MDKTLNVLSQLVIGDKCGAHIVAESDGLLTEAGVYIRLQRMCRKGLIERSRVVRVSKYGPMGQLYKITDLGIRYLKRNYGMVLIAQIIGKRPEVIGDAEVDSIAEEDFGIDDFEEDLHTTKL